MEKASHFGMGLLEVSRTRGKRRNFLFPSLFGEAAEFFFLLSYSRRVLGHDGGGGGKRIDVIWGSPVCDM